MWTAGSNFQTNSIMCNERIISICKGCLMARWYADADSGGNSGRRIKGSLQIWTQQVKRGDESIRKVRQQTRGQRDCASGRDTEGGGGGRGEIVQCIINCYVQEKWIKPQRRRLVRSIQTQGVIKTISVLLQDLHTLFDLCQFHSRAAPPWSSRRVCRTEPAVEL